MKFRLEQWKCIAYPNTVLLHIGLIKKETNRIQKHLLRKNCHGFEKLLEFQNESENAEEFMESLKIDLFSDMVFVFTPKGDVIELACRFCPN